MWFILSDVSEDNRETKKDKVNNRWTSASIKSAEREETSRRGERSQSDRMTSSILLEHIIRREGMYCFCAVRPDRSMHSSFVANDRPDEHESTLAMVRVTNPASINPNSRFSSVPYVRVVSFLRQTKVTWRRSLQRVHPRFVTALGHGYLQEILRWLGSLNGDSPLFS